MWMELSMELVVLVEWMVVWVEGGCCNFTLMLELKILCEVHLKHDVIKSNVVLHFLDCFLLFFLNE